MGPGKLLFLMLSLYGPWLYYGQVTEVVPCEMYGAIAKCSFKNLTEVPELPNYTEHLYLDFNNISELHRASLRGLRLLERVTLGAQKRPLVIRNNAFLSQQRLKNLTLDSNHYLVLEPRAFAGLYSLQELDLIGCNLNDSILSGNYLQPLRSLKTLKLSYNNIVRLRPATFFFQMRNLKNVELKNNQIDRLCEDDLIGFQGKIFTQFNLAYNILNRSMLTPGLDWEQCGNPFKNMAFDTLDLSGVGFDTASFRLFLKAIAGTPIKSLRHSGKLGRGFSFNNFPDPDNNTFKGLQNSSLEAFDLSNNLIFSLQPLVFSPLTDAKMISISHNKINQIHQGAFRGLENSLKWLNLSDNLIGEIYRGTFQHLTSLRILDLSFNHIGALGHQSFSGLSSLLLLNLNSNSLQRLTSTAYLPKLVFLYLNDNRLGLLYGINNLAGRNITHLEVEDNKLTFLDDIFAIVEYFPNLQTLLFGGNFIKWCNSPHTSTSNSLLVLDLHDSSLQILWAQGFCLDIFDHFGNLLGLDLKYNSIKSLPQGLFSSLRSIRQIDLSSNSLTYLMADTFPSSLQILDLSNNFLASPNPDTFRSLAYIDLAGNHFYCDCHLQGFLQWLNSTNMTFLIPRKDLSCTFPSSLQNVPLLSYANVVEPCEEDDERAMQELRLVLFIFSTLAVVGTLLGALGYARLRGHIFVLYKKVVGRVLDGPKPPELQENFRYDAFVCYSDADYNWVEMALLKRLDSEFSEENLFKCCFEARDFLPGEDHLLNIREAMWGSRKTLCVVSKQFLKDGWCLEAFTLAQGRKLEELSNVLIMIVVGKVTPYQLMKHHAIRAFLQTRGYLLWPEDPQDLDWFYDRLTNQILEDNKVQKPAEQPAEGNAFPMGNIEA